MRHRMNATEPTADDEPTPTERLPAREARTKLLKRTAHNPERQRQRNGLEIGHRPDQNQLFAP